MILKFNSGGSFDVEQQVKNDLSRAQSETPTESSGFFVSRSSPAQPKHDRDKTSKQPKQTDSHNSEKSKPAVKPKNPKPKNTNEHKSNNTDTNLTRNQFYFDDVVLTQIWDMIARLQ